MAPTTGPAAKGYRSYLPDAEKYPLSGIDKTDVLKFSQDAVADPRIKELFQSWEKSLETPFLGVTTNGIKIEDLYSLEPCGAPVTTAVIAANKLIDALTPDERLLALHKLESEDWRKWTNTEIILYDIGLRLETIDKTKIDLVWSLFQASLSESGYTKVRAAAKINRFLGQLSASPAILNENSYSFMIFGRPSETRPWGFSLSGHHLCVHVCFIGEQMVIGPVFIGCEPNMIDEGPDEGVQLFRTEASLALKLMQRLPLEQQKQAQDSKLLQKPGKSGWNIVDQRHLAGTGKDNRIIPYEGLVASSLAQDDQDLLVDIVAAFNELLPSGPLAHRLQIIRKHLSETYFIWAGGYGNDDAFYFRIQSPVVLVELDHHSGIYLTNTEPDKYHIHTVQRLPNGGDYGRELIRQWKERHPGKPSMQRMEYIRPFDEEDTVDTGFPKYRAQILSSLESAVMIASHIGEGGCGPGLHYHHSDQLYYLARGTMTVLLGTEEHAVDTHSLVFIPAGLPHRNWNTGVGSETHLEMIIPAPHRLKQLAYMIEKPEDVPEALRTKKKGYVLRVQADLFAEPIPGFKTLPLADPSTGSENAFIMYAEVEPNKGGPDTHVHEFDQYYFVLEGELTIEVALQKHIVKPDTLVVLPAGVPHRQYNQGHAIEKHITINTPAPEPGRMWDYGVNLTPTGVSHSGSLKAAREVLDTALMAG